MNHIKEAFPDVTVQDFWRAVDDLDDMIDGKDYKKLIKAHFQSDGKSKKTVQALQNNREVQEFNETINFIPSNVGPKLHMQRIKDHKAKRKQEIKEIKENIRGPRRNPESD